MVGKLRENSAVSEPVAQVGCEKLHKRSEKKMKKKRDRDSGRQEENEVSPQSKVVEGTDSEIPKKKKKHKKSKDDNPDVKTSDEKEEPKGDENSTDGSVVVTGKGVKDGKFAPLKSFVEAGLPDEVLECCRTFKSPSPIQSHAWPFLLHARDFIGIAATGSGNLWILLLVFMMRSADLIIICDDRQDSGVWCACYYARLEKEKGQDVEGAESSLFSLITYEGISSTSMCLRICNHLNSKLYWQFTSNLLCQIYFLISRKCRIAGHFLFYQTIN